MKSLLTGATDISRYIMITHDGNSLYIGAYSTVFRASGSGGNEQLVVKYDLAFNILWGRAFGAQQHDYIDNQIAVDKNNAVYTSGRTYSWMNEASTNYGDALYTKISENGSFQWSRHMGGNHYDRAEGIAVSKEATVVFISGWSNSSGISHNPYGSSIILIRAKATTGETIETKILGCIGGH